MDIAAIVYRVLLCVYGTIVYAIVTSTMAAYPHAHCRGVGR